MQEQNSRGHFPLKCSKEQNQLREHSFCFLDEFPPRSRQRKMSPGKTVTLAKIIYQLGDWCRRRALKR
jgi:hypothetical protein